MNSQKVGKKFLNIFTLILYLITFYVYILFQDFMTIIYGIKRKNHIQY